MTVGFGKHAIKRRSRRLYVMAHLKRSNLEVKAEDNCLAHALVIVISKVDKHPKYDAFRKGRKIWHMVQTLIENTGIDLSNGTGIPEIVRFQKHFREYKKVDYNCLSCDNIMFEGQVDSAKRLNIM